MRLNHPQSDGRDDDDPTGLQFDHVVAEQLRDRLGCLEVSILKTANPDHDDVVEYRALRRLYQEALRLFYRDGDPGRSPGGPSNLA